MCGKISECRAELNSWCGSQSFRERALCALPYDSFEHDRTILAAASEGDAALYPEFKFEFPMTHWVVYLLFDSGKLIYNGLSEPYCVPLDRVHGFGDPMLQSMKENQCLRSEWGCHERYPNALTMELGKTTM
ncbi:hypothetical protein CTAM01_17183 [Colletotrichum tamarilloi]|uniref:Uncharacterized protein n=1 Tax=Colletotrichum tamarilloi TaxID=1209934 RepID=A0ABQ9QGD1_9PEZI|nr:uncharacterized protein CTAM01_17183 [Colletotrichum tamarilloi]KAK1457991.1 hypothetical protein CTAM01_17183 [Colletotrichum tamarilloi]